MAFKKDKAAAQIAAFMTEGKDTEPEQIPQPVEKKRAAGTHGTHSTHSTGKGLLPAKGNYEQKTKRVNLLLQPSVYKAAQRQAKQLGYKSFNDYVNELLKAQTAEG